MKEEGFCGSVGHSVSYCGEPLESAVSTTTRPWEIACSVRVRSRNVLLPQRGAPGSAAFMENTRYYLLSYKKDINLTAQINLNIYNNKKRLQLNIKDVFI